MSWSRDYKLSGKDRIGNIEDGVDSVANLGSLPADSLAGSLGLWIPRDQLPARVAETVVTEFQSGHGWTGTGGTATITDDTSIYALGNQSVKMVTDGTGAATNRLTKSLGTAFDLTGKQIKVMIRVDDVTKFKTANLYVSSDSFTNFGVCSLRDNLGTQHVHWLNADWLVWTISWGQFSLTGTPTRSAITTWRLAVADNGAPLTVWTNLVSLVPEPANGVLSLCFDDGFPSQYTEARKKMDQYRFPGTVYPIVQHIDADYMTLAQLKSLQDQAGWEVGGHAYTSAAHDAGFTTLTDAAAESEFLQLKRWALYNGFRGADHFAWPSGDYDAAKLAIARRYFRSMRDIYALSASTNVESYPPAEVTRLRTVVMNEATTTASVATMVTEAINNKEWLLLTFHNILSVPTPGSGTEYAISKFGTIIDNIASQGIRVKTVGDVIRTGVA